MPRQYLQGKPIGYNIVYYPVNLESNFHVLNVSYTTNTTNLTELDVYTLYAINVSAVSSGGVGPAKSSLALTGSNTMLLLYCLVTYSSNEELFRSRFRFNLFCYFPITYFYINSALLIR